MELTPLLKQMVDAKASDIFVVAGRPVTFSVGGSLQQIDDSSLMPADTLEIIKAVYELAGRDIAPMLENRNHDEDFSFAINGVGRFRANVFRQRGSLSAVIRVIPFGLPNPEDYEIPEEVLRLSKLQKGMVLVTGPAGSGKSTTLACVIDRLNHERAGHIITMEDPIEYLHSHRKSIVSQREVFIDTPGYLESLRSALRESPDVILLGEMRDFETISAAITAAETGVLLFSTLHTSSAANTINRIVDVFPAAQQVQIRGQLAQLIRGVVCQQLVPATDGTIKPVFEVLKSTPAIQNMIRENKLHQLESAMQAARGDGMMTMDGSLFELYQKGVITKDTLLNTCNNYDFVSKRV